MLTRKQFAILLEPTEYCMWLPSSLVIYREALFVIMLLVLLLTYRTLFLNLIVTQLVKKILLSLWNRRFITVFTKPANGPYS